MCASHSVCWVHHQRKFQLDLPPYLRDFRATCSKSVTQASLPGDNRALEPPDSIPNSEVKRRIADGSVGFPHVRVGHCQAFIKKGLSSRAALFFCVRFVPFFSRGSAKPSPYFLRVQRLWYVKMLIVVQTPHLEYVLLSAFCVDFWVRRVVVK